MPLTIEQALRCAEWDMPFFGVLFRCSRQQEYALYSYHETFQEADLEAQTNVAKELKVFNTKRRWIPVELKLRSRGLAAYTKIKRVYWPSLLPEQNDKWFDLFLEKFPQSEGLKDIENNMYYDTYAA